MCKQDIIKSLFWIMRVNTFEHRYNMWHLKDELSHSDIYIHAILKIFISIVKMMENNPRYDENIFYRRWYQYFMWEKWFIECIRRRTHTVINLNEIDIHPNNDSTNANILIQILNSYYKNSLCHVFCESTLPECINDIRKWIYLLIVYIV